MAIGDIRLVVFDVDGVLTDGRLYFGERGERLAAFDIRDGAGIKYLQRAGLACAFLSGRASAVARRRARDLGVRHVISGVKDKAPALEKLCAALRVRPRHSAFVGDDLMDLPAMRLAGWSACPADAVAEVRRAVDFVARARGGRGAAREIIEHLLKEQRRWPGILRRYLPAE